MQLHHLIGQEAMDADHDQLRHRSLAMPADQLQPGPQQAQLVLARLHRAHGQHKGRSRGRGRRLRIKAEPRIEPQHAGGNGELWQQFFLPSLEIRPHTLTDAHRMVGQETQGGEMLGEAAHQHFLAMLRHQKRQDIIDKAGIAQARAVLQRHDPRGMAGQPPGGASAQQPVGGGEFTCRGGGQRGLGLIEQGLPIQILGAARPQRGSKQPLQHRPRKTPPPAIARRQRHKVKQPLARGQQPSLHPRHPAGRTRMPKASQQIGDIGGDGHLAGRARHPNAQARP